jgi:hypothetical protein
MLEEPIERFFHEMADQEQPQSRVSIKQALRDGCARLRRRRLTLAVGTPALAGAAVLAIVLPAVSLPAGSHGSRQQSSTGAPLKLGFKPTQLYANFGWLPAGAAVTSGGTFPSAQYLSAAGGHSGQWVFAVYARGACHLTKSGASLQCPSGGGGQIVGHAPAVDGRSALWLAGNTLAWRYHSNAWATLANGNRLRTPADILRIARAVKFGLHTPIEFASRLTLSHRRWQVLAVSFAPVHAGYFAQNYWIAKDGSVSAAEEPYLSNGTANLVTITTVPQTPAEYCNISRSWPKKHLVIHGYRLTLATIPWPGQMLCGRNEDGLFVWINEMGAHQPLTPVGIMYRLQLLGTTPADWVTNPLP